MARDFFGSEAQQALLRKGYDVYRRHQDDPMYTYYGRTVGINSLDETPLEKLVDLARRQGGASCGTISKAEAEKVVSRLEATGLSAHCYARWDSLPDCLPNARNILATRPLADDLVLDWLLPDKPDKLRERLAGLALEVGVLPPNLSVLTGELKPAACAMALNSEGDVVACAAAAAYVNAEPPDRKTAAWWGMLATREDQRGRGLSLFLSAAVIDRMADRYNYTRVFTGVTPGNAPSEAVCRRMKLADSGTYTLSISDPNVLPGGRLTK